MINYDRIREICEYLDVEIYGKDCNFIDEDSVTFYSRDYCHSISFEELIKWYIKRIDIIDVDEDCDANIVVDKVDKNIEYLMELIKIYSIYNVINQLKYKFIEIGEKHGEFRITM